jgi:hypothetical protein
MIGINIYIDLENVSKKGKYQWTAASLFHAVFVVCHANSGVFIACHAILRTTKLRHR